VVPFELIDALAIFQYLMNDIFQDLLDVFIVCYLDDILIYFKDAKQQHKHVQLILK